MSDLNRRVAEKIGTEPRMSGGSIKWNGQHQYISDEPEPIYEDYENDLAAAMEAAEQFCGKGDGFEYEICLSFDTDSDSWQAVLIRYPKAKPLKINEIITACNHGPTAAEAICRAIVGPNEGGE